MWLRGSLVDHTGGLGESESSMTTGVDDVSNSVFVQSRKEQSTLRVTMGKVHDET